MPLTQSTDLRAKRPRTLIPIMPGDDHESLLRMAKTLTKSGPVLLLGVVPIAEGESLSTGAQPARELRQFIQEQCDRVHIRAKPRIRVTYNPWQDIKAVLRKETKIRLMVLDWEKGIKSLGLSANQIITEPPCDIALVRGPFPEEPKTVLVPMRGGPHAERAFEVGLSLAKPNNAQVKAVRIRPTSGQDTDSAGFASMAKVLAEMPEIEHETVQREDGISYLLENAKKADVVVLGTTAHTEPESSSFGRIPDALFEKCESAIVAVKTKREVPSRQESVHFGAGAISVLVDQWFAENTFHADEFTDFQKLAQLK